MSIKLGAGCPVDIQPWCCEIPAIHSEQLIAGYLLIFTGVPIAIMMINVIFSKVLGPYPQVNLAANLILNFD
jgi:hypothetical protein